MEQKIIDGFPIVLAHATPICHYYVPISWLSKVRILPNSTIHKTILVGALFIPMLFQRKEKPAGG